MADDYLHAAPSTDLGVANTPASLKQLRACKTCRLVKTYKQFLDEACENCPHERPMGSRHGERDEFVQSKTTSAFTG